MKSQHQESFTTTDRHENTSSKFPNYINLQCVAEFELKVLNQFSHGLFFSYLHVLFLHHYFRTLSKLHRPLYVMF